MRRRAVALALAAIAAAPWPHAYGEGSTPVVKPAARDDPGVARAWRVLRVVDCARCHGRSYDGLAAPSIVDYAATQTREQFDRMVIDGDPTRGMPGYRGNPYVIDNLEDIRRYFIARANGEIGADYRAPPLAADR